MSDERRKRQQERLGEAPKGPWKKIVMAVLIVAAFGAVVLFAKHRRDHRYDAFAQCLTAKKATMYGLYWCEHCADQKDMFGASFQYVTYVECGVPGRRGVEQQVCIDAGAKRFPTWQFSSGEKHEGTLSLEVLSQKTGCSLP